MGSRLFSFLLLVACLWVGIEIYTQGTERAFGGALSRLGTSGDEHVESTFERVRRSASGARDRRVGRMERQLGEGSVGLQDRSADRPRD